MYMEKQKNSLLAASYTPSISHALKETIVLDSKLDELRRFTVTIIYKIINSLSNNMLPFVRSQKVARLALKIIKESDKHHHTAGKDPLGMAAMAVYLASRYCGEDVTQRQVADAGEVTKVTIRNRMKTMEPLFEKMVK